MHAHTHTLWATRPKPQTLPDPHCGPPTVTLRSLPPAVLPAWVVFFFPPILSTPVRREGQTVNHSGAQCGEHARVSPLWWCSATGPVCVCLPPAGLQGPVCRARWTLTALVLLTRDREGPAPGKVRGGMVGGYRGGGGGAGIEGEEGALLADSRAITARGRQ